MKNMKEIQNLKKINFIKKENTITYFTDQSYLWMSEAVEKKQYETIKILKDNHRSFVALITFTKLEQGTNNLDAHNLLFSQNFVLKIPREKNKSKKEQFLSIFKGSESKREFKNMVRAENLGFLIPEPILAVEEKTGLKVVDSYSIFQYIEHVDEFKIKVEQVPLILETLYDIHNKGYLHGDPQLANFLVNNNRVFLIDCKLSKNLFGIISKIREFIYFEKSCYREIDTIYKKNPLYTLLKKYDTYKDKFNYFSKKIRGINK